MPPLRTEETPLWLRHLHWLLILALIPLAISLLRKGDDGREFSDRLMETLDQVPSEAKQRIVNSLMNLEEGKGSLNDIFEAIPDHRLAGALLPRHSWGHWLFALIAAIAFMAFFLFLASDASAQPWHLLGVGLFTATLGILFLLLVQLMAQLSHGIWFRGSGIAILIFYFIKLIGFSYQAALDPDNGFVLSFIGFTLGVGFCEEVCKALPVLARFRGDLPLRWRGAFLWGMASGVGFGVSEGITYSSDYYNGIHGSSIYLVRFISCVALHALWSGSVAITIYRRQDLLQQQRSWYEYLPVLFTFVAIPMVLHGLYDTLLKKDMNGAALAVAAGSFVYLAFQISRLNTADDVAAEKRLLREYRKRRAAMS